MLKYIALVNCARKGLLSSKQPFQLYGAICQQVLSIIAMNSGAYTKISDLFHVVNHLHYLSRELFEDLLSELAQKEYTQHHGFKNQYGGNEKLYLIQDHRLIYGNFGLTSQMIPVMYSKKNLGEVPYINLLRIRSGNKLRFAGKTWYVKKTSPESIQLEPAYKGEKILDFIYPGTKIGMETFIANKMWEQIHIGEISKTLFDSNSFNNIFNYVRYIKKKCTYNQIPSIINVGNITYYTFAGYFVNKAVALLTNQIEYTASDLSLTVAYEIEWHSIPVEPIEYKSIFYDLFEARDEQSIYQRMLSDEIQVSEFIQDWLKDNAIKDTLKRLTQSISIKIEDDIFV
jgi:ATP-dependent Lhr-like helicase